MKKVKPETKKTDKRLAQISKAIYSKKDEFTKTVEDYGYSVVSYIEQSYSVGSILETDNHAVVVCKGSEFSKSKEEFCIDIKTNINCMPRIWAGRNGCVHSGYTSSINRMRYSLREALKTILSEKKVYLVGHSLGAISSLLLITWILNNPNEQENSRFYEIVMFGSPRCATQKTFDVLHNNNNVEIRRYVMNFDFANLYGFPFYSHPCSKILLHSPFNFINKHSIDTYIYALDN